MREIKFRAWDRINNIWRDVEELIIAKNNAVIAIKDSNGIIYQVNDSQIAMAQYTGLKDKNGKEIYEGDVVSSVIFGTSDEYIFYVLWDDEGTGFEIHPVGQKSEKHGMFYLAEITNIWSNGEPDGYTYEVIGNIYENPELLK